MFRTKLFSILLLLSAGCFAQPRAGAIDTTDVEYQTELRNLYSLRSAQTAVSFESFSDRKMRKAMISAYEEFKTGFFSKLDDGLLVRNSVYDQQIGSLLKQIAQSNPQYAALSSSRVLLCFSDEPNAMAIGDDFVLVNLPLLSKLDGAHELAFIICHELAHNLLDHPLSGLTEHARLASSSEIKEKTREIEKQKYNKGRSASKLFKDIVYANRKNHRRHEFQADSLGFVLYRNAFAGHGQVAVSSLLALDKLDKETDSLTPQDYEKLFSTDRQPFKPQWVQNDEIAAYKYDRTLKFWQVDSLKTHPDCIARAERLSQLFKIGPGAKTAEESHYAEISEQAKYDQLLGLYAMKEYGKSLYETLLLLKEDKDNPYLRNLVRENLLKIQQAQKRYTMNKHVQIMSPRYSYSYNMFLNFLRQLRKNELTEIINFYSN